MVRTDRRLELEEPGTETGAAQAATLSAKIESQHGTLMRFLRRNAPRTVPTLSIAGGLGIWELLVHIFPNSIIFVSLSDILTAARALWTDGQLGEHVRASGYALLLGYSVAVVVGIVLGIVLGISRTFRMALQPWIFAFYSIPLVALAPIFIVAFGIGQAGHTAVIITISVFPIIVNTMAGIRTAEEQYLDVARAYSASEAQVVRYVLLPSAVPFIITGMRLAVARALIGVVVGELFGARAGVGYMIILSQQRFDTAAMYVGIIILAFVGIVTNGLLQLAERKFDVWRPQGAHR